MLESAIAKSPFALQLIKLIINCSFDILPKLIKFIEFEVLLVKIQFSNIMPPIKVALVKSIIFILTKYYNKMCTKEKFVK